VEVTNVFGFGRVVWLSVAALTPLTVLITLLVTGLGTATTRTLARSAPSWSSCWR
jgi:hypothetical protein